MSDGPHVLELSAVAAGREGPRSGPLAVLVSSGQMVAGGGELPRDWGPAARTCLQGEMECFRITRLVTLPVPILSAAAVPDGRVFFIEDGRYVRVLSDGALLPEPAWSVTEPATRMVEVLVDRSFTRVPVVRIASIDEPTSNERSLSITLVRELANRFYGPAVVVPALPLPAHGQPLVTQDAESRINVAVPADDQNGRGRNDVYAGSVVRLTQDGQIPWSAGQRSPIFVRLADELTALAGDAGGGDLWVGARRNGNGLLFRMGPTGTTAPVMRLMPPRDDATATRGPVVTSVASLQETDQATRRLAVTTEDGLLLVATLGHDQISDVLPLPLRDQVALSVVPTGSSAVYLVARSMTTPEVFSIFRVASEQSRPPAPAR